MKIALVSPPLLKTPPTGYGGLEIVVYDLGCALVEKGHDVTLFAPKGSRLEGGKLFETIEAPEKTNVNWIELEGAAFNKYREHLRGFDVIHCNTWFAFPYLARVTEIFGKELKICHTHHGHFDWRLQAVIPEVKPICLVAISQYMQSEYKTQGWESRYVYNGINLGKYPYSEDKQDRLVFVARISKFKQPHLAIEAAVNAKVSIDVIGGSFVDDPGYIQRIRDMCEKSNGLATLHLDLPHEEKIKFIQSAKACLVPSDFKEPFGLTAVESLACGTPVIALNDGALKEIITSNVGLVCNTNEEFVEAVRNFDNHKFSSKDCLNRAEYFSRGRMADRYLKVYKEVMDGTGW